MSPEPGQTRARLESWKEIAAYLGRGERTVRRWEAAEGLPVRRIVHRGGASVYALPAELEAWRNQRGRQGPPAMAPSGPRWVRTLAIAAAPLALFALWWLTPVPPPRLVDIAPITHSGRLDYLARLVASGDRIYYLERAGDHWTARQAGFLGGSAAAGIFAAFPNTTAAGRDVRVFDAAPDGRLLVGVFRARGAPMRLWSVSALGGAALPVGSIASNEAVWDASGRGVLYLESRTLWQAAADGASPHPWTQLPGLASWFAWSPDRRQLRFTLLQTEQARTQIWRISATASDLRPIFSARRGPNDPCCGAWTQDGRYYLFSSGGDLWATRERYGWRRTPPGPFQLTFGPTRFTGVVVGGEPARAAAFGAVGREEVNLWNPAAGRATVLVPARPPAYVAYSADGEWAVFLDRRDGSLWRSRADGRDAAELTRRPLAPFFPRLSPRGERIAFAAQPADATSRVYLLTAGGGAPRDLLPADADVHDADWAPDGQRLVVVHAPSPMQVDDAEDALYVVDAASGRERVLPGSAGLFGPRWSPTGGAIAAVLYTQREMRLYDIATSRWRVLARGTAFGIPAWSRHGRSLYFQDLLAPGEPIYRWQAAGGQVTQVAEFSSALRSGIDRCAFVGLTPANQLLVSFNRGSNDLFAGRLILP